MVTSIRAPFHTLPPPILRLNRAGSPVNHAPLYTQPGDQIPGPLGRPMRGLLPVRVRQLEPAQPDSGRPTALGRVWQAANRKPALPVGNSGRRVQDRRRADAFAAEDRRLLLRR